uniref:Uncharacterized protein n=1 Tax=Monopterus albus TaxID=43700 RepID=A0A3Q3J2C5_MONAL
TTSRQTQNSPRITSKRQEKSLKNTVKLPASSVVLIGGYTITSVDLTHNITFLLAMFIYELNTMSTDSGLDIVLSCLSTLVAHNKRKLLYLHSFQLFAKERENKPDEYWQNTLWSDETKINLFGSDGIQHTVKYGGGRVLISGMTYIDYRNSNLYTQILNEQTTSSHKKHGWRRIFQHDNDPKHANKDQRDPPHLSVYAV